MKKSLLLVLLISSAYTHSSMLNSSIFTKKEIIEPVVEVSKWSIQGIKNALSNVSASSTKDAVYNTVKDTTEPLTTFAYENVALAATATAAIAFTAYKIGKYMNAVSYDADEIKEVAAVVIQAPKKNTNRRTNRD